MADPEILTATEASRAFSEMLHRVCYGGESFIIKKGNRLMARVIPVEPAEPKPVQPKAESQVQAAPTGYHEEELTPEEAAYYQTVIEQLQKMVPESCE